MLSLIAGDEVIVPAYAHFSSNLAISETRLKSVFSGILII